MNGLIVALLGLQVVDGAMTVWGVQHKIVQELNPFAVSMVKTWWNIPLKVIPTSLVCLFIVWLAKKMPRLRKPLVVGLASIVILMVLVVINGFVQIGLHYGIK